jgi:glutathione S-transferase
MILHDLSASMHPRRVRIFLAEKGMAQPTKVVDAVNGENKTDDFLRMNSMGRLPVLQLDVACVDMWPHRMEQQVSMPNADVFLHSGYFYPGRIVQVPAYVEWLREQVALTLKRLEGKLAGRFASCKVQNLLKRPV